MKENIVILSRVTLFSPNLQLPTFVVIAEVKMKLPSGILLIYLLYLLFSIHFLIIGFISLSHRSIYMKEIGNTFGQLLWKDS